jgi:hypothetical protein
VGVLFYLFSIGNKQIVFSGAFARRSFGIHINDETVPFVEAIAYESYLDTGNTEDEGMMSLYDAFRCT